MVMTNCSHEYKKTVAKSGISFESKCQKCEKTRPYCEDQALEEALEKCMFNFHVALNALKNK